MILIKNGTINTITNGVFVGDILIQDKKIIKIEKKIGSYLLISQLLRLVVESL